MTERDVFLAQCGLPEAESPSPGSREATLTFAEARYVFRGLSDHQLEVIMRRFGELMHASEAPVEATVTVRIAPSSFFRDVKTKGWEYVLAIEHGKDAVVVAGLRFVAQMERSLPRRTTLWVDSADSDDFIDPFENVFRVLVAYSMTSRGGLVLHSAGFASEGHGFVCFGHSGAGKTTLTGIVDHLGLEVLSDELNAIVPTEDGFELLAMPFAGDFGRARADERTVPLRAIYRLEQAALPSTRSLGRAAQVAQLVGSAPFVNGDPHEVASVLSNAERLSASVPVKMLAFAKDARFWPVIRNDVGLP